MMRGRFPDLPPRMLVVVRRRVACGEGLDGGLVDVAVAHGLVRVASARLPFRGRDFTGFQNLLEAVQVFLNLLARLLAPHLRDESAERASRRVVLELDPYFGPAP